MKPRTIFNLILFFFPVAVAAQNEHVQQDTLQVECVSSNDSTIVNLKRIRWKDFFKGKYHDYVGGLAFGYVNKDWVTDNGDNGRSHEDLWGRENRRLHGFQIGLIAQPCFKFGIGLHAGFFYEMYKSENHIIKDAGYDNFMEHNFYIPVHAMYRIPIVNKISLTPYFGIGLNCAMIGCYNTEYLENYSDGSYRTKNHREKSLKYGGGQYPKRLNGQLEAGVNFSYKIYQVGFTYSHGLNNHKTHLPQRTIQNKLAFTLALLFGK